MGNIVQSCPIPARRDTMLIDAFIKNVKPADKPKKYADGGGLFLYVSVSGSKLRRKVYIII